MDRKAAFERLVYPVIGDEPSALKRSQIVRLLDKIQDGSGDRTADLALAYLRKASIGTPVGRTIFAPRS